MHGMTLSKHLHCSIQRLRESIDLTRCRIVQLAQFASSRSADGNLYLELETNEIDHKLWSMMKRRRGQTQIIEFIDGPVTLSFPEFQDFVLEDGAVAMSGLPLTSARGAIVMAGVRYEGEDKAIMTSFNSQKRMRFYFSKKDDWEELGLLCMRPTLPHRLIRRGQVEVE